MWYVIIAGIAYFFGRNRVTRSVNEAHEKSMALLKKDKIAEEKRQHCDMSLYLMQKSMTSNDAYDLDEWLESKGVLKEYNAFLAKQEEAHQKKFNMSKAQLTTLFEESYLRHYEKFTDQHEAVLNS